MFNHGQGIIHVKTGVHYRVIMTPMDHVRLEYCNEQCYSYRKVDSPIDSIIWIQCKSEMEDGRFKLHEIGY